MLALVPVMLLVAIMCGVFYYWLRQRGLAVEEQANPQDRRRVSLLTEVIAYIGAALVLVGSGVTVGQSWSAMTGWEHVGVFAGTALFFLTIGLVVFWVDEGAIQRMISVLWLISATCAGAAAGIAAHDVYGAAGAETALATGLSLTIYSAALWLVRRRELQMIALFAGLTIAVSAGIIAVSESSLPWLPLALGLWALGIGWVIVGWQYPQPLWTTMPLGMLVALIGPSFAVWSHGWVFLLAIATAAVVMTVSVPARNTLLLAAGTLAFFGYISAAGVRYFRASLGLPASLATCGVLLIALAIVMAWMRRRPGEEVQERYPASPAIPDAQASPWRGVVRRISARQGIPREHARASSGQRAITGSREISGSRAGRPGVPRTGVPRTGVPPTGVPDRVPERERTQAGLGGPAVPESGRADQEPAREGQVRAGHDQVTGGHGQADQATLELPRAS